MKKYFILTVLLILLLSGCIKIVIEDKRESFIEDESHYPTAQELLNEAFNGPGLETINGPGIEKTANDSYCKTQPGMREWDGKYLKDLPTCR